MSDDGGHIETGLSSTRVNALIGIAIADVTAAHRRRHPFRIRDALGSTILKYDILAQIAVGAIFVAAFAYVGPVRYIVEAAILIAAILLSVTVDAHETLLSDAEMSQSVMRHYTRLNSRPLIRTAKLNAPPPTTEVILAKRDGRWLYVPINGLVEGDVIVADDRVAVETLAIPNAAPLQRVTVAPLRGQLTRILTSGTSPALRPPKPRAVRMIDAGRTLIGRILIAVLIVYVVIVIIRLSINSRWDERQWFIDLFYRPAVMTLILSLCFSSASVSLSILNSVGNGWLFVVQEALQNRTRDGFGPTRTAVGVSRIVRRRQSVVEMSVTSSTISERTEDDGDGAGAGEVDDSLTFEFIDSLPITVTAVAHRSWDIFCGSEAYITRTSNPLMTLGGITVFCCMDNDGILSENEPSPDHIALIADDKPHIVDVITDQSSSNGFTMSLPQTVADSSQVAVNSLKPIGLTSALVHSCHLDAIVNTAPSTPTSMPPTSVQTMSGGCLCPLAREIGFDVSWVRRQYYIAKVLRYQDVMTAVAIIDRFVPGTMQLLVNGTPNAVLRRCTRYWNGHEIKPLNESTLHQLTLLCNQWQLIDLTSLAFAYAPLPPSVHQWAYATRDTVQSQIDDVQVESDAAAAAASSFHPPLNAIELSDKSDAPPPRTQTSLPMEALRIDMSEVKSAGLVDAESERSPQTTTLALAHLSDITAPSPSSSPQPQPQPPTETTQSKPTRSPSLLSASSGSEVIPAECSSSLNDLCLTGLIGLRDQPKIEVRSVVEHLMSAGIRFVYFSPSNERKTQAFGAKIGLFTDFNVYVSLADPNEKSGRRQGKSQLPCGVSAVREHLRSVDNVPLLVSLFTECTPSNAAEMIRIYQENGECVMTMGSSLKPANSEPFLQSDIAASLDPIPSSPCPHRTYVGSTMMSGTPDDDAHVEGGGNPMDYSDTREFAMAAAITSLPCALSLSLGTDLLQFIALVCEGRRLLTNVHSATAFAVGSALMTALVAFISFVVNSPPPFNGYQVMWLTWLIIPILSAAIAAAPRTPDVMTRIADKNVHVEVIQWLPTTAYWGARFVPSALLYLVIFTFAMHETYDSAAIFDNAYWSAGQDNISGTSEYEEALITVQSYLLVIYVIVLCFIAQGFLHRFANVAAVRVYITAAFLVAVAVVISMQIAFTAIAVTSLNGGIVHFGIDNDSFKWAAFFVLWAAVIPAADTLAKRADARANIFSQRRARQHFDTVLGMHSPK